MKNLAFTEDVLPGKVYVIKMHGGETNSFRILTETPTHYIFSYTADDGQVEVFEKAKQEVSGIFEVKEWWELNGEFELKEDCKKWLL